MEIDKDYIDSSTEETTAFSFVYVITILFIFWGVI